MITALHGFLGLPSDWDFLKRAGFDVRTPDLREIPQEGDTLLGYSLGGRLALHALLGGARYRNAVIVSAGLGVEDPKRIAQDEHWADRFEQSEWYALMRDWSAQPLFGGHAMPRHESDFDRRELARQLREWSPAVLPMIAPRLHEIAIPVLWIAGSRDEKYVAEGKKAIELLPRAALWIADGAAHRVPWEQPEAFAAQLREFIQMQ
ncbi:MAG TPA: alpha/beta fold hydrolase [Thermoanaerobaculia bacterium]|nr:alpha/beta fold hydrolase [Thermoanaerobaculia bacterium]